ncbi:MAG: hypothetical protein M1818_005572 [Claussenomyces sp. TS43310]|nr:MAG: hypothetical protein M1818_005572 [Claussenomyces sp. TS43310]
MCCPLAGGGSYIRATNPTKGEHFGAEVDFGARGHPKISVNKGSVLNSNEDSITRTSRRIKRPTITLDLFNLAGKTALITGGGRGISRAMAIGIAESGADIILILRNESQCETEAAIEVLVRKCHVYIADLGGQRAVSRIIPHVILDHSFEILVNGAGIQRRIPAAEFAQDVYQQVMQTNLGATFALCRDTGRYWIDKGIKGRIINVASLATFQGGINMAAYSASKGAVGQLTKALSNEWAKRGIVVNAIAPRYVLRNMGNLICE